jgi:hypothetical protein
VVARPEVSPANGDSVTARRNRLSSKSGEHRCNVDQQAAVRASLGPREDLGGLGWWQELAEKHAHRSGVNGGPTEGVCALRGGRSAFYRRPTRAGGVRALPRCEVRRIK